MGFFSLSIPILLFASSLSLPPLSAAADTLTPGESISGNQTLVSAGGAFALGFFSPAGATVPRNRYLGIWYKAIPNRTVVWVANRETPLTDPAGIVTVTDDRNLAVLDSNGTLVWSSAIDGVPNGTVAVLLDSGNLVLRQGDGRGLWQSFDHPTDTLLPGMKLGMNLRTGVAQRMVAWRAAGDPSPGAFSFGVDPPTTLQAITWRGSEPYWRSHVWNGWSSSIVRRINATAALYVLTYSRGSREASLAFSQTEVSAPARYVLEPTGTLKTLVWVEANGYWDEAWSRPSMFCDPYNRCGPSGTCDSSGDPPTCRCLQGFVPRNQRDWDRENYSWGCVRRVQLRCDRGDKFLRAERMKLPDRFTLVGNRTEGQCQAECLDSCRCTAYAYAKVREGPDRSRCLLWVGDLVDLEMVALGGEGLNVRLVASELVTDAHTDGSSGKNRSLMLILLPSLVAGVLLLGFLGYFLKRRIEKQRKRQISEFGYLNCSNTQVDKDTTEPPLMNFSTILAATNNFSAANKLGEGGFGPVYKGVLNTGQQIAIKRLSKDSGQGQEEFKNEVALIAKLQHRNLVRLLGSCIHGNERILIYEYLPNYSLDFFIFDATKQAQLDWARRFNIIKGIARGLMYLHQDSRFKIVHRDLKASNVLLDEDMNPKISDFGMARIFGGDQNQARTNRVIGTYGYMSPEYAMRGLFSVRSDVYSFGVLLLEIISGQRNVSFHLNDVFLNLLTYAWQLWEEDKVMLLLDASISQTSSLAEVSRCVHVGLLCVQDHVDERPAMSSVVFMLENDTAIHDKPKRPMFMLERRPWKRELQRGSPGSISANSLTNTLTLGR